MRMSLDDQQIFDNSLNCSICQKGLGTDKVRDHCHSKCNLDYKVKICIPVFFHNFSKYDCHLFFQELGKIPVEISLIPINKENYNSVSKKINSLSGNSFEIRFLDTYRFMPSSLDTLASNLVDDQLNTVKSFFSNDIEFRLMRKEGIYPYECLDSASRLEETSLPQREAFYSNLTERECSQEDYDQALKIWSHFSCSTLKDYLELYLKTDVFLLTEIFEIFRKICMQIYSLDPAQYFMTPGLSWEAMLKTTNIRQAFEVV